MLETQIFECCWEWKKTANHKKSHWKPDWARSRWKRESLLPYRLVSQSGKQANRSACWFSFLMASACLNLGSPRQEPGPGMTPHFRRETEHRAHLVSLMCCMGQCCCFFCALTSSVLAHYCRISLCKSLQASVTLPLWQSSGKKCFLSPVWSKCDLIDC